MKTLFLVSLVLVTALPAFSQTPTVQQTIRWSKGAPNTDSAIIDGKEVKSFTADGVTVAVKASEQRVGSAQVHYDKAIVQIVVFNGSERRVEISPDGFSLEMVKPQLRTLERETAEHLSKSMNRRAKLAGALGEIGAGMQTTQITTNGSSRGTISDQRGGSVTYQGTNTSTTTGPDVEARRRAEAQSAVLSDGALRSGAALQDFEIKANTIFPGQQYGGILIFERDKKCEDVLVRVAIDGKVLEFPFAWQRK